ncbi:MAG: hypothetical protein LBO66_13850 [Deltaproteobacteria bacterium]|nr:hypothetical protein [Deltaproteobacteria bacterium]
MPYLLFPPTVGRGAQRLPASPRAYGKRRAATGDGLEKGREDPPTQRAVPKNEDYS